MRIGALRLHNVRRFAARGVAIEGIGDGVNVLCAANEQGKSTSFEALHALFFLAHSSVAADAKALRPYSGGSPFVEADIETASGRYRIEKRFFAGRAARVSDLATGRFLAQADEAEAFIAELVRGGTAGPAGLLWVRQGVTGIEARSRTDEDREARVRASLLESVQGEVEAVTGGRRMAEIMARTQSALGELVTATGRPRTGGRFDAALQERNLLREREDRLGADVRALRQFLDARAAKLSRLAELDREDERRERLEAVRRAEESFEAAKARAERLRTAEAELALARDQREAAGRDRDAFRAALKDAGRLATETARLRERQAETTARRDEAWQAVEAARVAGETAEREAEEARALLAQLEAALRAREAAERRGEIAERLRQAEAAQREIETHEANLAHLRMPPKAVEELQALEVEIARGLALAEAARPSVTIAYEAGTDRAVTMDGTPLEGGQPRAYDGRAELRVPGIGTIQLRESRRDGGAAGLAKAQERRRTLLETLGLADLAEARERQTRAERVEGEIGRAKARLSVLAPEGLQPLRESLARDEPNPDPDLELKGDPASARAAFEAAEARRQEAREAAGAAGPVRQRADDAFVEVRAQAARLDAESAQNAALLGPTGERAAREAALAATCEAADRRLAEASAAAEALRAAGGDLASVEATLKRLRSVGEAAAREIQTLREEIAGLNAEIRTRSEEAVEESWRECVEALEAAERRVSGFEREVATLQRLAQALDAARSQARELYLKPVMAELTPLLGLLFDDVAIRFDEKTLLPQRIERGGQEEEVERLSGGMREQLSVLTRLAFARLLARDGRPAPVILDDALVYSDDDRIEKMFDALHRQSSEQQIIVFSCRQRAFQRLGGNVLTMTDWHPSS